MKNSVVMATYNGERFIVKQLDSIKNQTLPPDEVIICDDCSTDNTAEVVREYIASNNLDGWQFSVNEKNLGFYNNFFGALKKCSGDIIYFSDQDDIWDLNKIKTFSDIYEHEAAITMIQSNHKYIDENGDLIKNSRNYHGIKNGSICELTAKEMCRFCGSGFTMSFRKQIADIVFSEGFDKEKSLFEFHDIVLGLVSVSRGKVFLCRDIIDFHRLHDNNVTEQKTKSLTSGRTKEAQSGILERRNNYFSTISNITEDKEKRKIFSSFSEFAGTRFSYIRKPDAKKFRYLKNNKDMYASRFGIISDTLYAIGLEKIVMMVLR